MELCEKIKKIALVGGDMRMLYCAKRLFSLGFEVAVFGFDKECYDIGGCTKCANVTDALTGADTVVLPIPVTGDGDNLFCPLSKNTVKLSYVLENIKKDCAVFGGNLNENVKDFAKKRNINIIDYFDREEVKIANAFLTSESAVAIAIEKSPMSLREGNVLVMGYGRIGKTLASLLKGMGANVFVSARKNNDFAWIRAYGYSDIHTSAVDEILPTCSLVFNTIPESVLEMSRLCLLRRDCLVVDLASKPGGVDFDAAKQCGLNVVWALGLPGKMKPKSAGKIICEIICDILEDEVK